MTRTEGAEPPDPGRARTVDDVVAGLRALKLSAGDPSYDVIRRRVDAAWRASGRPASERPRRATVADCFRPGRRRLNADLVIAVVQALHPDVGYVTQWRQALRVVGQEAHAAAQVRVQDLLPPEPAVFTGRDAELARLRQGVSAGRDGPFVIRGMAGVGKTQLAVRAGHDLLRSGAVARVLFVNLRGFHPDPAQPPASPDAVLDGFLRLLGVPGQRIPHDVDARRALYRERLAGTRTLVVLDDAAGPEQVVPLLPGVPGCPVLVTTRRRLTGLATAPYLTLNPFSAADAAAFLARSIPGVALGADPDIMARIARRCGHLPLALALLAGHIADTPGWTLTDHADRLDERHRERRLDDGVHLALDVSYRRLPAARQRVLRLAALHPGQEVDAYAAAALTGGGLDETRRQLDELCCEHLMQRCGPGRYKPHDLVRAYAIAAGTDADPPSARRAAMTGLADYYVATAAAALDLLYPLEAYHRPRVSGHGLARPRLASNDDALAWLDTELTSLLAVAGNEVGPHTVRLSTILYRYLDSGHPAEALTLHGLALRAATDLGDVPGQAHALNGLGTAHLRTSRYEPAAELLREAVDLFGRARDAAGQARVLGTLGNLEKRLGRYQVACDHYDQALRLFRQVGDEAGQARSLRNLGVALTRQGHFDQAGERLAEALATSRRSGDRIGEADCLAGLGELEGKRERLRAGVADYERALELYGQLGDRASAAMVLDDLGALRTRLGRPDLADRDHRQALVEIRAMGDRDAEAWALNGLGEAACADRRPADAIGHHDAAWSVAAAVGSRDQQARAHAGLGHAHAALGRPDVAREHFARAVAEYEALGMPEADRLRARSMTGAPPPARAGHGAEGN